MMNKSMVTNTMKAVLGTILLAFISSCTSGSSRLSGAGATFPLPFYNLAFEKHYIQGGAQVSYGGIGSGGGIRSLQDETVDFAGSDSFLSDEEMHAMRPVLHIPTCMGAVVMTYNLPGVDSLKLTGDLIAKIYLGEITRWNDPLLVAVNEEVQLPDKEVVPVYRSDGSGTTYVLTDYLSKVSNEWAAKMGCAKTVPFAHGVAAKGNPAVAGNVSQVEGAIGYVGSEYAFAQSSAIALLQNACGEWVRPTTSSIMAAAQQRIPDDTRCSLTNSPVEGSYPISLVTWILVYEDQSYSGRTVEQAQAVRSLLNTLLSAPIQQMTTSLHYAPLSDDLLSKAHQQVAKMTYYGVAL